MRKKKEHKTPTFYKSEKKQYFDSFLIFPNLKKHNAAHKNSKISVFIFRLTSYTIFFNLVI